MSLSQLDEYPIHQTAEVMRHVATSDRNFYDRYYFNAAPDSGELFLIFGLGQYPNLGTTDAFALASKGDDHIIVRASKALGADRMDTAIGPFRIEVIEGLRKLRVVCEPTEHDIAFDLTWEGNCPATLESRQFWRKMERVYFDTQRFAQTGVWSGRIEVDGTAYDVTPDSWSGTRDRSWGVRPVGEAEPPGRGAAVPPTGLFWIYAPISFGDFSVITIVQEEADGNRLMESAVRVWADPERGTEWLGRPEHDLRFASGTRDVVGATLTFHRPGRAVTTIEAELLTPSHIAIGTGYGLDADWRHGMWQGDLVVQGVRKKVSEFDPMLKMFGVADIFSRFTYTDDAGTVHGKGLFEVGTIGPHEQYGFKDFIDPAP
jgi:hypothetical protein